MARFEDIIGQDHLVEYFKKVVKEKQAANAYIIEGEIRSGKEFIANVFAMALQCEKPGAEPCNECHSCIQAISRNQPDIIYVTHEKISTISVDDIRTQVGATIQVKPYASKRKIYIISESEKMNDNAQNALLKTLEEPPAYAVFILATTEKNKVLPTIISRCQVFDFNRMNVQETVAHLKDIAGKEGIEVEDEALNVIAMKADGGMRDALSIFDRAASFGGGKITYKSVIEDLNILDFNYYFKTIDFALSKDISGSLLMFDEIVAKGFDTGNFVLGLMEHIRNVLVCRDEVTAPLLEAADSVRQSYIEQSKKCSQEFLLEALEVVNDCAINYKQSKSQRLTVELMLIRLCQLTDQKKN